MLLPTREALLQSIPSELPKIIPLTSNASSWVLHLPRAAQPSNRQVLRQVFRTHPLEQHALQLYGKRVLENRFSQMYVTNDHIGSTYKYSGVARPCHCCDPSRPEEQWILDLCHFCNILYSKLSQDGIVSLPTELVDSDESSLPSTSSPQEESIENSNVPDVYNCCLVNWYRPEHHIGLHADDERELNSNIPIVSVSWGGPRRFLLRPKPVAVSRLHPEQFGKNAKYFEVMLQHGDVLLMGGKCQQEFKHEIPKVRKMDGVVGERVSWTIRSMHTTDTGHRAKSSATAGESSDNKIHPVTSNKRIDPVSVVEKEKKRSKR